MKKDERKEKILKKNSIFLSPLDWGLGHATRCIPLIRELQQQNITVIVGASSNIAHVIQSEFPEIKIIPFSGYDIKYSKNSRFFLFFILLQLPKILFAAWKENRQLKKIVVDYQINAIISDNRLGCYHKKIPSVFITHQLQILTGNQLLDKLAMKANYFFINRFTECWVPDVSGEKNLAGLLSHPKKLPKVPVKYIGNLSRLNLQNSPITIPLTILISGPEPQRTIFEELMVKQSEEFDMPVFIIRGLPESNKTLTTSNKNLQYRNHLAAAELSLILQQSEMIIARSGYSTVMDLLTLQKKGILIPTPGQTEQEYLAKKLSEERLFFSVSQHEFNFKKNLEAVASFQFQNETFSSALKEVIEKWKDSIN